MRSAWIQVYQRSVELGQEAISSDDPRASIIIARLSEPIDHRPCTERDRHYKCIRFFRVIYESPNLQEAEKYGNL